MARGSFYVRWGGSRALRLTVSGDTLVVEAENARITLEPRSIAVEAGYRYKREIEDKSRKNLYIGFSEPLKPIEAPRVDILGRGFIGNFEVIYTDLDFEKYLTIITPASAVYDYVVLTNEELMVQMPPRRKLYYEEEPYDKIVVYIV